MLVWRLNTEVVSGGAKVICLTVQAMKTPILDVRFFATESGNEPVREWLKARPASERRKIGEDIKTVQFGWPLGMPECDADNAFALLDEIRERFASLADCRT